MSDIRTDDLNTGTFATSVRIEARRTAEVKTVQVKVDNKAATRQAIIVAIRREGITFKTRSAWKASTPKKALEADWNHTGIAIHHAGNSYSCGVPGADQIHKVQDGHMSGDHLDIGYHFAIDCDGVIYEGRDIRYIGAHIGEVRGVIGIVFLSDLSEPGEEREQQKNLPWKQRRFYGLLPTDDDVDIYHEAATEAQIKAISVLVAKLKYFFRIEKLGGHKEWVKKQGTARPCPGVHGMEVVLKLRKNFNLASPE